MPRQLLGRGGRGVCVLAFVMMDAVARSMFVTLGRWGRAHGGGRGRLAGLRGAGPQDLSALQPNPAISRRPMCERRPHGWRFASAPDVSSWTTRRAAGRAPRRRQRGPSSGTAAGSPTKLVQEKRAQSTRTSSGRRESCFHPRRPEASRYA